MMVKYLCDVCDADIGEFRFFQDKNLKTKFKDEEFVIRILGCVLVVRPDGVPLIELCYGCLGEMIKNVYDEEKRDEEHDEKIEEKKRHFFPKARILPGKI